MPTKGYAAIKAIVFDLDGTLYVANAFAATIQSAAAEYIAGVRNIGTDEADRLIAATRIRMTEEHDEVQTLSAVCAELGGNIRALHSLFEKQLRPEAHLNRDERVITLLDRLGQRFSLSIYTNNNRNLATRIIAQLGLNGRFGHVFTIDDNWRAKPDEERLEQILAAIGLLPSEALFVGDRYDIDLRLPEQKGCPVFLSQNIEQLLRLETLLA